MGKAFQPYLHQLRSPTFSANGQDAVSLEGMPTKIFGRIAHLIGFMIKYVTTPTYTTAPTNIGQHSLIRNLVFWDGVSERFNASFYDLRQFEILENGSLQTPDSQIVASLSPVTQARYLPVGPANFEGNPTDFAIPVSGLKSGELRLNFGALTDWSADTTAQNSVGITITAVLVPIDNELRLPPAFERRTFNFGTTEAVIQAKALYTSVGIAKQSNAVFAAGDLTSLSWDAGLGQSPTTDVASLNAVAQYFLHSTIIGQLVGEPQNATNLGMRTLNLTTPTALQASDFAIQSVIMSPVNSRITKLLCEAQSALRVRWTGSFATPKVYVSRILENPLTAYATMAARASSSLGMRVVSSRVKTLDKTDYKGPRALYMPMAAKVA